MYNTSTTHLDQIRIDCCSSSSSVGGSFAGVVVDLGLVRLVLVLPASSSLDFGSCSYRYNGKLEEMNLKIVTAQ